MQKSNFPATRACRPALDKGRIVGQKRPLAEQSRRLQKFAAVHSSVKNHFNQERHHYLRGTFKLNRAAALSK